MRSASNLRLRRACSAGHGRGSIDTSPLGRGRTPRSRRIRQIRRSRADTRGCSLTAGPLSAGSPVALPGCMRLRPYLIAIAVSACASFVPADVAAQVNQPACRQDALAILLRRRGRSHPRSAAAEGHAGRRRHRRRDRGRDRPAGVRESRHAAHSRPLRLSCVDPGGRVRHDDDRRRRAHRGQDQGARAGRPNSRRRSARERARRCWSRAAPTCSR